MATASQKRRERRENALDVAAERETCAIRKLRAMVPKRKDAGITESIHWAPKSMGKNGRFKLGRDSMRGAFVRGSSDRTPKLISSYIRSFG